MKIDSILILAAGKGTRLKPHTDYLPKSLLPLENTNILRRLIGQCEKFFPRVKIYINTSYLAERIIEEVANCPLVRRPHILWEKNPLGPSLTVTNHCNKTNGNVLVLHGDVLFSDLAFSEVANSVNQKMPDVSILLCHQRSLQNARSIINEKNGLVQSILEVFNSDTKNKFLEGDQNKLIWSSSGAMVVKSKSLANFDPERGASLSPYLINYIARREDLHIEKCTGTRISIDNEESYLKAIEIAKNSGTLLN